MKLARLATALLVALCVTALAQTGGHLPGHMPMHGDMRGMGGKGPAGGSPSGHAGREVIELSVEELHFVLDEMDTFLASVQGISQGLIAGDMKAIAAVARTAGMGSMHRAPPTLAAKMPDGFKVLGMDTHQKFDALAVEAETMGDRQRIGQQLQDLFANCASCHQRYRLTAK